MSVSPPVVHGSHWSYSCSVSGALHAQLCSISIHCVRVSSAFIYLVHTQLDFTGVGLLAYPTYPDYSSNKKAFPHGDTFQLQSYNTSDDPRRPLLKIKSLPSASHTPLFGRKASSG